MTKKIIVLIFFLIIILYFLFQPINTKELDTHIIDCQKCFETQNILKSSIYKYQVDKKINELRISSEEEFSTLLDNLLNGGYLKNTLSPTEECSYRYLKNDKKEYLSCIKHGNIYYVSSYERYKFNKIFDFLVNFLCSFLGIYIIHDSLFRKFNKVD